MKTHFHPTVKPYLDKVRSHQKPYATRVFGKNIIVYPNVMSPKYDWSSRFHIKNMPDPKGRSFLEIGSGCGIISLFASFQGAKKIVCADINPNAIKNTKVNLELYNVKNTKVVLSDVFQNIRGIFDIITFAAPYHGSKPNDFLEFGVTDYKYQTLKKFLSGAHSHLKPHGTVLLGFSNTGDVDYLHKLIQRYDWKIDSRKHQTRNGWTAYLYNLSHN